MVGRLVKDDFDRHCPGIVSEGPRKTTKSVKAACVRDELKDQGRRQNTTLSRHPCAIQPVVNGKRLVSLWVRTTSCVKSQLGRNT